MLGGTAGRGGVTSAKRLHMQRVKEQKRMKKQRKLEKRAAARSRSRSGSLTTGQPRSRSRSRSNSLTTGRSRPVDGTMPGARRGTGQQSGRSIGRGRRRRLPVLVNETLVASRRELPMYRQRDAFLAALDACSTLVLVGETGSGKSTQIPQFLYEAGYAGAGSRIGVTQPRRVAAQTVAKRVAAEMGVTLGQEVGYSVRFDDCTSASTVVKYLTDGMLLREAMGDADLSKYSVIVLDEAHERSLHTDILLGLIKALQRERRTRARKGVRPLKVIVMSATLNASLFADFFHDSAVFRVEGRQHPVDVMYTLEPEADYVDAALIAVLQIHLDEKPGDVLLFLTGQAEIEQMETLLTERSKELPPGADRLIVRPIYAALPKEEQLKAFAPTPVGSRKVILATNIAESSITLPGVKYVVDPGMAKQRCFRAKTGMESLVVNPISQQQAKQRAGRAGREGPGKCFRLFEEKAFLALRPAAVPEIRRCNLATVVLQLKAIGVSDVRGFDFIERPSEDALCGALAQLLSLGALASGANGAGEITPLGREMASLPLEPVYAKLVIVSARPGFRCLPSVLTLVALLSVDSIFFCPKEKREEANAAKRRFAAAEGDHLTMINAYDAWCEAAGDAEWCHSNFLSARSLRRARDVREQLVDVCRRQGMHVAPHAEAPSQDLRDRVRRCLVSACFANVARRLPRAGGGGSGGARRGGGKGGGKRQTYGRREYKSVATGQRVCIHPASVMFGRGPKAVIFGEMVLTTRPYMRCITEVDPMWLPELAPQCFRAAEVPASEPRSAGAGAPASATGPSPAPSRTSPLGSNSADDAPAPRSRAGAPTRKRRAKVEINPSILARSSAAKRCRRGRPFA